MSTISLTNSELFVAREALLRIQGVKMPIKAAYSVSKLLAKLTREYAPFEEQRVTLIKYLGVLDEATKNYVIPQGTDNHFTFMEEIRKLQEIKVEMFVQLLDLDHFGSAEIEPNIIAALDKFIEG